MDRTLRKPGELWTPMQAAELKEKLICHLPVVQMMMDATLEITVTDSCWFPAHVHFIVMSWAMEGTTVCIEGRLTNHGKKSFLRVPIYREAGDDFIRETIVDVVTAAWRRLQLEGDCQASFGQMPDEWHIHEINEGAAP